QVGRQVLDVIEKRGSALDVLEEAGARDLRSGERARSMTEELGLEELRRDRRAVDRLEERIGARTERVNTARDELLPSAGLARDQDGELGISHAKEHRDETAHRRGASDDFPHDLREIRYRRGRSERAEPFELLTELVE